VLQNATGLSCLQVRAGGGSASERRYAARIAPLLPGTGGRWAAYSRSAANCGAVKLPSGGGQRVGLWTALCRAHRAAVPGYRRTMGCMWQQRCKLQRC